jgi:hypothetical protein
MDIIISSPPANSKCLPITPRSDTDETWEGFQLELTRQNFKKKKTWENDTGYLKKWWFHDEEDNNDDNDDNHSDDNDDNNDNDDNDNDN